MWFSSFQIKWRKCSHSQILRQALLPDKLDTYGESVTNFDFKFEITQSWAESTLKAKVHKLKSKRVPIECILLKNQQFINTLKKKHFVALKCNNRTKL